MRRVTELACPEQPGSRLPASAGRQQAEAPTVDEFTVLEDKEEELKCARPRVEQVFKVTFTIIGLLDHTGQPHGSKTSRQIWLQLRGTRDDVSKAKVGLTGLSVHKPTMSRQYLWTNGLTVTRGRFSSEIEKPKVKMTR